jgi:hypothetical protein
MDVDPILLSRLQLGALQIALEEDERLAIGYRLLQRFRRLIARRGIRDLDTWLNDAIAGELAPFVSLPTAFNRIAQQSTPD